MKPKATNTCIKQNVYKDTGWESLSEQLVKIFTNRFIKKVQRECLHNSLIFIFPTRDPQMTQQISTVVYYLIISKKCFNQSLFFSLEYNSNRVANENHSSPFIKSFSIENLVFHIRIQKKQNFLYQISAPKYLSQRTSVKL